MVVIVGGLEGAETGEGEGAAAVEVAAGEDTLAGEGVAELAASGWAETGVVPRSVNERGEDGEGGRRTSREILAIRIGERGSFVFERRATRHSVVKRRKR